MAGRCAGKVIWPELLGKEAEVAKIVVERETPGVKAIIVKPGSAVIRDYRCDRVWIWINQAGYVFQVPRVG